MTSALSNLMSLLKTLGVHQSAIIKVQDIQFNEAFRGQCEQNSCGSYNKNWMCPPLVGSFEHLRQNALKFEHGLLFQTVHQLEDSFDYEGMQEGMAAHTEILMRVLADIKRSGIFPEFLPLNVGPCTYCGRCAFIDGEECRFPEEAISSIEAYGIDVMALEKSCGMTYNNGKNTVSYASLILFNLD